MKTFAQQCMAKVKRIEADNDEGIYAKAYASDVPHLINEIERLQAELNEIEEDRKLREREERETR